MNDSSGMRLHSRYQPQLEADRYIEALNPSRDIDYYILIEPGLGYLIPSLRKHCPDSKLVVLHACVRTDAGFHETEDRFSGIPQWFADSGTGVQEFLEDVIPEGASARIIEWRPSLRVYGNICLDLVRESAEFIKRSEANRRTGASFGRRWVRNFFRNLALPHRTIRYRPLDMPIVITGSGPSLESALSKIHALKENVFILAASSSLTALAACGITPDMVISTDGGGWALLHLHACFRMEYSSNNDPCPLAFSLSAAIPSQCSALPLLPLNDGSLWQSIALHSIKLPSALIPQRGTVSASALELAMILGSGNIFLAGMNLSVNDIKTHVRPYGFDHLFFGRASRFRPVYSQCFMRSGDMKAGGSHDVYAAWFKSKIASWPRRIFSLGGNHAAFEDNLPRVIPAALSAAGAGGRSDKDFFEIIAANDSPEQRCTCAAEALIAALDNPRYAAALSGELAPLLFPSYGGTPPGTDVQPEEIARTLRGFAARYGKAPFPQGRDNG